MSKAGYMSKARKAALLLCAKCGENIGLCGRSITAEILCQHCGAMNYFNNSHTASLERGMDNWVLELFSDEGDAVLNLVKSHRECDGHKPGYDKDCLLCRAASRISLGRDYGFYGLRDDTKQEIIKALGRGK